MLRLLRRFRLVERDAQKDGGVALVVTIGLGLVMMILVAGALGAATSGLRAADTSQDGTGALDAAYSGAQDYLARLNNDPTYANRGNPAAPFTIASGSAASVSMPAASIANPAFNTNANSTAWASVAGSGGAASFRYEVDNHAYSTNGILRLRSTGRVGNETRSLVADIRQKGFTDFVYFTTYEMQDPLISGVSQSACATYLWDPTSPRDPASCGGIIQFAASDTINGPVHTNDSLSVCGATFKMSVETGRPGGGALLPSGCTSGTGTYQRTGDPAQAATLDLPSTSAAMKNQVDASLTASPGCLYTGPTTITLLTDGRMNVVSPWTKHTQMNGSSGQDNDQQCGRQSDLASTNGATVPVPTGNVVYVQDVQTNTADPNYWPATSMPANFNCYGPGGTVNPAKLSSSTGSAGWWFGSDPSALRHPLVNETPAAGWSQGSGNTLSWATTRPAYGCTKGDVYVSGTLADYAGAPSRLSIAAANYAYITGDISYKSTASDLLGIVGDNGVLVYNPMQGNTSLLGDTNRTINASLLSTARTFQVQNHGVGSPRGTLNIYGSIGQKFRGPVATSSGGAIGTGYAKNYVYDPRLAKTAPPYFVTPAVSSFRVSNYAAVKAGYLADGTGVAP